MATYNIGSTLDLTRQCGDDSDIVFNVPDILTIAGGTAKFRVYSNDDEDIFELTTDDDVTIDGDEQTITVVLSNETMTIDAGSHKWELEFTTAASKIHTIGKGKFIAVEDNIPKPTE